MNYTEKYHLPQWVKEDRIMMEDFNQMCADMEAGLNANANAASAAKAQADKGVSDAASAQAAANAAQATADNAVSKADAAQTTANQAVTNAAKAQPKADAAYSPSQQPYVVGSYTGTNAEMSINVGFRPKLVLLSCGDGQYANENTLVAIDGVQSTRLEFTATGFKLYANYISPTGSGQQLPYTNTTGRKYIYIAFR